MDETVMERLSKYEFSPDDDYMVMAEKLIAMGGLPADNALTAAMEESLYRLLVSAQNPNNKDCCRVLWNVLIAAMQDNTGYALAGAEVAKGNWKRAGRIAEAFCIRLTD